MSYTSLNGFKGAKGDSMQKTMLQQETAPTVVKFAGEEAKDKLYEPKHKKKLVRVLTVIAYMFFVSLAAIMLSMYYVFLWNGEVKETRVITVSVDQTPLMQELLETKRQLEMIKQQNTVYLKCKFDNDLVADVVSHQTKPNDNPEEKPTTLLPITSTEEDEENTTWPDYSEFEQKKKRSVFIKKIMNFKDEYMDTN